MQVYRIMIYCPQIFQNSCPPLEVHKFLADDGSKYKKTTFAPKMWSKTHIGTNLRLLCEIDQKVLIFVEKLKKKQPLKMTFRVN